MKKLSEKHKRVAVLGLCRALPDIARSQKGRLQSLFKYLVRDVDRALVAAGAITPGDLEFIRGKLESFRDLSGWGNKDQHICTYVTFCMLVCENTGISQCIIDRLQDIWLHFARAGKAPAASDWAGVLAAEKWEVVIDG